MVFFSSRISPFTSTVILRDKIAAGHGGRHFGDVSHLAGQVAGHGIDGVGQVFPRTGHARHLRLAAEFAFGAHFASNARHFARERVQLVHHRVDGFFQLAEFRRCTSTVIFLDKSPLAMAVATSAIFRTWPVRLTAIELTLSVKSFHVPATPGTCA